MSISYYGDLLLSQFSLDHPSGSDWINGRNQDMQRINDEIIRFWSKGSARLSLSGLTPVYDLSSNTLATQLYIPIGTQTPADNKELHVARITGTLGGAPVAPNFKYFNGLVFDLINGATTGGTGANDVTRVRGVIGTVTTTGPGSIRFLHAHALGSGTATGFINALNAQVSPVATTVNAWALELNSTGVANKAKGIVFGQTAAWDYGIDFNGNTFNTGAMNLTSGVTNGRIYWNNGTFYYSDALGRISFGATSAGFGEMAFIPFGGANNWRWLWADNTGSGGLTPANSLQLFFGASGYVRFESDGSMVLGSPTGGAKGIGTLNAKGVYDDNVLLTDFVFEPEYPLPPIGELRVFFEEHKHLPTIKGRDAWEHEGSFSLGQLSTMLWETVEVQARYIAELHSRVAVLEAR